MTEAGELAGVSRQLVYAWCKAAGIDPAEARRGKLIKLWGSTPTRRKRRPKG